MEGNGRFELNSATALAAYDDASIQRGVRYAAEGRVTLLDLEEGWAVADVQGTRTRPYLTEITWRDGPRGLLVTDVCDCPLGGGCKHAVAVLLAVMRQQALSASAQAQGRGNLGRLAPDWRLALAGIEAEPGGQVPLALEFGTHVVHDHRNGVPVLQVVVQPMRMGAKGRWIKSGATWNDIVAGYDQPVRDVVPEHLTAIRTLAAANSDLGWARRGGAQPLDRFGPTVWAALRRVVDAGVQLITDHPGGVVTLAAVPAEAQVDLRMAGDGGITLTASLTHEGRPIAGAPGKTVLIGRPPTGVVVTDGSDIGLIPLAKPVHHTIVPLIEGRALHVPEDDVDELFDVYQPRLSQMATVGSSDGSVTIEPSELEGIVAVIRHESVDEASLKWVARYRRGVRRTDHPLLSPLGVGRDRAAERELMDKLELPTDLLDRLTDVVGRPADLKAGGVDTVILFAQVVPWLLERGQVAVEVSGDAPTLREATEDPLIELHVDDPAEEGNDWFDLSVRVTVGDEPVEFSRLFTALSRDEPFLVLDSGTWIDLDRPELDRLRELIDEARSLVDADGDGPVRINPYQTSWWDELTTFGVVASQSVRWKDRVARLQDLEAPTPVPTPPGLSATLRHYQQEGLDWLAFLHANGLGGILADDMGLGKTVQTLALFLHVLESDPDARFLVVAPTSVVENWHREADRFAPGVAVHVVKQTHAKRGISLAEAARDARVVVTSYALFRLDFDEYAAVDWDVLVLDEAQFVKNHQSKAYQCARRLDAHMKLAITGTPIENSLMDLWSLLSITAPGLYPDPKRFSEVWRKPIESGRAPQRLATLRKRVAPLMRRRTKDEVLTELPPKTEQTVEIELGPRHQRIYQAQLQRQRQKVLGLVDDVQKHRFEILKSLTILRQLSLDPVLVDEADSDVGSAKIDRLMDDLSMVVAEGHKALVFSQFTRYLRLVRARLDEAGIAHAYLDGRTRDREKPISSFKDGDVDVFVISLKAGGFGLNLTEADYCFVLDPWWNPATETQAVDRAHRIGQRNAVMVYRYVSAGTIEEKVMELKAKKAAIFSSVMEGDDALSGALDADDIRALFDGD
ncbi:DEAD/DEAH box helicase [Dermatobacter hominis]|uniref:DEAD/DEAH box helicase n=1 Tax=Dermatobacter hominis TaxID=2884263 RepID=UPI001D1196AC|nr:SNF2-related protein [Dermatobacter hominis]UDY34514.1 DEAD/DEAH box helicase [Dermatobacter hominis]